MALQFGAAVLSAQAALVCSTTAQRITITPGNVRPGGPGTYGPLATDSWVTAPGLADGIYGT